MTNFDEKLKNELQQEDIVIPEEIHARLEQTLNDLPDKEEKISKKHFNVFNKRILTIAASFVFALLVFMPNVSVTYAQVMSNIPVIGVIIDVFTIRNYNFQGENHELNADIPNVEITDGKNEIITDINADIDTFTTNIIQKFYEDLAKEGTEYSAVDIDYVVVTNSDTWFTLKINVTETQASGYMYAKFYHINRETGEYVTFTDLFDKEDYSTLEAYIISEMKAQMEEDSDITYFFNEVDTGEDIKYVTDDQNFYFDKNNNLVMVYDEYTVAPGYMGMPEIVIPVEVYGPIMK